jgi:cyanophycinase
MTIIRHWLAVLLLMFTLNSSAAIAQTTADQHDPPRGRLLLIGGSERDNNALIWDEVVRLAGGAGKTVAIFPTASNNPQRTGQLYALQAERLGLKPVVIPASPLLKDRDFRQVARDPEWVERVRSADAVFLTGGEQVRYRQVLVDENGKNTPLLDAIWHVYRKGGLVMGTSAGMAVMSRVMFIDADLVLNVMLDGANLRREVHQGLGFMPKDWFVDQHFLTRGRFGRTLVAMQTYDFPFAIGIDEDTAVVIEAARTARIIGYRGAVFFDASEAKRDPSEPRFNTRGVRLSYLSHDDQYDLITREVKLGPQKKPEDLIDPSAPGFKPYYPYHQYFNDILANTKLLDLMVQLVDSPWEDAIGLAFSLNSARQNAETPGFEFRFYRTGETKSWDSPTAIGDPYTVLDVFLDIRPITIRGPLYK